MQTDSGYTLVELLMATAVGAVVVAAAYASYAVVSGYYEKLSDMADLQDTGRQSLYMMVRDIRMAGYEHYAYNKATKTYESEYGPVSGLIKITDSGDACCDGIDVTYDLGKCRGAVGRDPSTNQEDKAICEKNGGTWDGEVERVKIGYYTLGKCRGAAGGDQAACEKNGGTWTGRLYRSKAIWKKNESKWSTDEKDGAYQDAVVADHIENFQVQQCPLRLKWSGKYTDIATDASGNVWVADYYNHRVEKFDSSGTSLGKFNWGHAYGVATDANGYVYVANYSSHQILKIDPSTGNVKLGIPCRKGPCAPGSGAGQFLYLNGVDVDASGNIYVAGSHNTRIQKFDKSGNFLYQLGPKGTGFRQIQFSSTADVATDADGNVWVADFVSNRIQKFDPDGKLLFGIPCKKGKCAPGSGDGQFISPDRITTDAAGNVYVAEWANHRIQKFDSSGNFLLKWGSKGSDDCQFKYPKGIAIDARGNVYVAEPWEGRVQKFNFSTVEISLTVKTRKEHGREKRAYTRRDYNPGNYDIKKNDKFIRDEFSTTVYIRNYIRN